MGIVYPAVKYTHLNYNIIIVVFCITCIKYNLRVFTCVYVYALHDAAVVLSFIEHAPASIHGALWLLINTWSSGKIERGVGRG